MKNKRKIILISTLTIILLLLFLGTSQNNINDVTNASTLPTIKPTKEKKNLEKEIEKELNAEKSSNNDQVVSMFLEMLSKEDPNVSYLFAETQEAQAKQSRTDKENKKVLEQTEEYITEDRNKQIINCIIKDIKRTDSIDTYKLEFTLMDEKQKETTKVLELKVNSLGQIIEI